MLGIEAPEPVETQRSVAIALRGGIYAALAFWLITSCLVLPFAEGLNGVNPSMVQVLRVFFMTFLVCMLPAIPVGIVCGVVLGTVAAIMRKVAPEILDHIRAEWLSSSKHP
jgi:hypothetical protein